MQDEAAIEAEIDRLLKDNNPNDAKVLLDRITLTPRLFSRLAMLSIQDGYEDFLKLVLEVSKHFFVLPQIDGSPTSRLDYLLYFAVRHGAVGIVNSLMDDFGASVTAEYINPGHSVLAASISRCDEMLVRCLLSHDAPVNYTANGCHACFPLMTAAHAKQLQICKLLVEHGGLVNAMNAFGLTPLSYALMGGDPDVIAYLRSVGAQEPWELRGEPPPPPPSGPSNVSEHIQRSFCGGSPKVLTQAVPGFDPAIRILKSECEYGWILCTEGMSYLTLNVPDPSLDAYRHVEVYIYVPEDWPLDEESLKAPKNRWPVDWLYRVAKWPSENGNSWLGKSAIFSNDDPPQPLCEGTQQSCMLAVTTSDKIGAWTRPDGVTVTLYMLFPIYAEERDFEREHGTLALLQEIEDSDAEMLFNLSRRNVALRHPD